MKMHFYVHDRPRPQGSKRHVGHGVMIESSDAKTWREAVKQAALDAKGDLGVDDVIFKRPMPVRLTVTFHFRRLKSHFGTGRNSQTIKESAPHYVATMPDLSKLVRATEDALTAAGVWDDDAQVAILHAYQVYNDNAHEGAAITITEAKPQ